jgi:hypothetical protein
MNTDNKELERTIAQAAAATDPKVIEAFVRYAYQLGKSDGYIAGVLSMKEVT